MLISIVVRPQHKNSIISSLWSLIFDHMTADQHRKLYSQSKKKPDHPSFTKGWVFIFGLVISKQLNAVPYLHGETIPAVLILVNAQFCVWTSFISRPMSMVFGLGMRLHVDMCTRRGVIVEFCAVVSISFVYGTLLHWHEGSGQLY